MSIQKTRSWLYKLARFLGDVQAVDTGHVGRRVRRRLIGRGIGRKVMRKIK